MALMGYLYGLATDKYNGFIAGAIKFFLLILAFIYGLVVRFLVFFYRIKPHRPGCKVISVGNITLGGTGKTSIVEFIARYLKQEGRKAAILTRGYGGNKYLKIADEPYMLSKNLGDMPVIVNPDRIKGAREAVEDYNADTVILDDGFQQWRIKKDLEIVTIDAGNPFGNQRLIPRGILREPVSSLKRADLIILTKIDSSPGNAQQLRNLLFKINPSALVIESMHKPVGFYKIGEDNDLLSPQTLRDKSVALISGIADPASFEKLIRDLGIKIGLSFRFPDHHRYTQGQLQKIILQSKVEHIDVIVTTQKDAARLTQLPVTSYQLPVYVLRIKLAIIKDEQKFYDRLLKLYHS